MIETIDEPCPPLDRDRTRVMALVRGIESSTDIPTASLEGEITRLEARMWGVSPERMVELRGTVEGTQIVARKAFELTMCSADYDLALAIMWMVCWSSCALYPGGWGNLDGLDQHIVFARVNDWDTWQIDMGLVSHPLRLRV